jgi:hypothetical protein
VRVHVDEVASAELSNGLDELVAKMRAGCWAPPSKSSSMTTSWSLTHETDEDGRRMVERNGHAEPRSLFTGADPIDARAPQVDERGVDEDGERIPFVRRSRPVGLQVPKVAEVLSADVSTG